MNRIYVVKLVFTASIRYRLVARSLRYRICIESMSIKTTFRRCNRNVVTSNRHRVNILKNRVQKLIRRCNRNVATSNRHGVNILKNRWFDVVSNVATSNRHGVNIWKFIYYNIFIWWATNNQFINLLIIKISRRHCANINHIAVISFRHRSDFSKNKVRHCWTTIFTSVDKFYNGVSIFISWGYRERSRDGIATVSSRYSTDINYNNERFDHW
jgi:hypothetical protein